MSLLSVQFRSTFAQSLQAGRRKVTTKGSTVNGCLFPMTGPVATAGFNEIRRTLEQATSSGDIQLQEAYQITNTPDDESSWDAATMFGSTVSTETIGFAGAFSSASLTKKWARFGVLANNVRGSDLEACRATLRVDLRYGG